MSAFCVFVFAFYVVSVSVVGWEKRRVLYQEPLSFVFCFFYLTLLRCVLCQEWFLFVILLFFRFCYGVFRSKNGSRVLFCSLFDSVGVVSGLSLLSFLCLFWLCFARVSRSLNKNGIKIPECLGSV